MNPRKYWTRQYAQRQAAVHNEEWNILGLLCVSNNTQTTWKIQQFKQLLHDNTIILSIPKSIAQTQFGSTEKTNLKQFKIELKI